MSRIAALIGAIALTAPAAAQPERFVLAIARADGYLVPFASYDNGDWGLPWPEPHDRGMLESFPKEVPSIWSRRGEAVPSAWTLWPVGGGVAGPVRANVAEVVGAHCEQQVALKTDLPTQKGKLVVGVATDATIPLLPISRLEESDPQWRLARRAVLAAMPALEKTASQKPNGQPLPPQSAATIRITALYHESESQQSSLYVVAEKRYRPRTRLERRCPLATNVTGWLLPTFTGTFALAGTDPVLGHVCGESARVIGVPLASLQVGRRSFWVLNDLAYEGEGYRIVEVGRTEVISRLAFRAGGC